jgi:hypothetical protein
MAKQGQNDTRRDSFLAEMKTLGEEHGSGMVSRPRAAMKALEASVDGYITPKEAKEVWTVFQQASAKAKGIEYKQEGSFTQQVSKFKNFLVLGQMNGLDVIDVMNRTIAIIQSLAKGDDTRKAMGGSAYDKMIVVAKAQLKSELSELTDEEIMSILMPDKKERDEEAILRGVARSLTRVVEGGKDGPAYPSPQSEQALNAVVNRLNELSAQTNPNPTGNITTAQHPDDDEATDQIAYSDDELAADENA